MSNRFGQPRRKQAPFKRHDRLKDVGGSESPSGDGAAHLFKPSRCTNHPRGTKRPPATVLVATQHYCPPCAAFLLAPVVVKSHTERLADIERARICGAGAGDVVRGGDAHRR